MDVLVKLLLENFWLLVLIILFMHMDKKYQILAPLIVAIKVILEGNVSTGIMAIILPLWLLISFLICKDYYRNIYRKSIRSMILYLNSMDLKDLKLDDQLNDDLHLKQNIIFDRMKEKMIKELKKEDEHNTV